MRLVELLRQQNPGLMYGACWQARCAPITSSVHALMAWQRAKGRLATYNHFLT